MEQNQIEIQIKPKNKDPEPNCIAAFWLSRFVCAAILLFSAMGKSMKVMKKVMKSTPAKGKPTSGNRNQTLAKGKNICKGEANLCKGEANLCKGETFEKWCSPGRNLEKKQLARVGAAVGGKSLAIGKGLNPRTTSQQPNLSRSCDLRISIVFSCRILPTRIISFFLQR